MPNITSLDSSLRISDLNSVMYDAPLKQNHARFMSLVAAQQHAIDCQNALGQVSCKLARCIIRLMSYTNKSLYAHHFFESINEPDRLLVSVAEKLMDFPGDLGCSFAQKSSQAKAILNDPNRQPLKPTVRKSLQSYLKFCSTETPQRKLLASRIIAFLVSENALSGLLEQPVRRDLTMTFLNSGTANDDSPSFRLGTTQDEDELIRELKICGAIIVHEMNDISKSINRCSIKHYVYLNDEQDKVIILNEELLSSYGLDRVYCA